MKIHFAKIKEYLTIEPQARIRANKNRAIGNLVSQKYGIGIKKETMANIVADILTYDRAWRKCIEMYPTLRGTDYKNKKAIEESVKQGLLALK